MKRYLTLILLLLGSFIINAQQQQSSQDSSKASFYSAFEALKNILEGKDSLNYEKAVFITENAYYNNAYDYKDFKEMLDFHSGMINILASNARKEHDAEYQSMKLYNKKMFMLNTSNWAIFKFITDTTFFIHDSLLFYKSPFTYTYDDPYGSTNWENTQVLHLLTHEQRQGNCYALASLFKIFSDRLKSDARLTVAPHHIYIQNRDAKGDFYNVELASKTFPPDGSIQTYTYTTKTSIMNGMSQRMLTDKEAVILNLIYLAKGYEHKYHDNTNDFLLNCAELAYKYDSLSLNALLLKAEVTENRLLNAMKENNIKTVALARKNKMTTGQLASYEGQLNNLYKLGYREIPKNIEDMILATIQHKDEPAFIQDKTPNPFNDIKAKQRYATLSWGVFDELQENVDTAQYYHALLNTETKRIVEFFAVDSMDNYKVDPVVFALSVDPLTKKFPELTPYQFASNSPIAGIDLDGKEVLIVIHCYGNDGKYTGSAHFQVPQECRASNFNDPNDKTTTVVFNVNSGNPANIFPLDNSGLRKCDYSPFIKLQGGLNKFVGSGEFKIYPNGTGNNDDMSGLPSQHNETYKQEYEPHVKQTVQFGDNGNDIVPPNDININEAVQIAKKNPSYTIDITSFTSDNDGNNGNENLGNRRAANIEKALRSADVKNPINKSYGGTPTSNGTEGDRRKDRKATIDIYPSKDQGKGDENKGVNDSK